MEARGVLQSHVDTYVGYKEEMVLVFYVDRCLMFSPSKDKNDDLYASLQAYFKIEDDIDLNKWPRI